MSPDPNTAPTDFDAIKSRWRVAHRRLTARFTGYIDSTRFFGTTSARGDLDGDTYVDDSRIGLPDGPIVGGKVRLCKPAKIGVSTQLRASRPACPETPSVSRRFCSAPCSLGCSVAGTGRPVARGDRHGNEPHSALAINPVLRITQSNAGKQVLDRHAGGS